jgi:hypothetical protein
MRICQWTLTLALAAGSAPFWAQGAEDTAVKSFYRTDFEAAMPGWTTRGDAEFAIDGDNPHGGARSARITVPAGAALDYPQHFLDFTAGLVSGDLFSASVWVRSRDVDQNPGAYFVLEFLRDQERVSVVHSRTGVANGATDWERLTIAGARMPATANRLRVSLLLQAHGTAWFDDLEITCTPNPVREFAGGQRRIAVTPEKVLLPRFGGVGFHVFDHCHDASPELLDTVLVKRWRELNPSYARVTHNWSWDAAKTEYVAAQMAVWKGTGTEIYLTTWDPQDCSSPAEFQAYARKVADMLAHFVVDHKLDNLKTYCLTNELSLKGWGTLMRDLPKFRAYHQAFAAEFTQRGLPVQLLATDASPIEYWSSIEWATANMDAITGVYGGHHYINDYALDDVFFYPWFLERLNWGAGLARAKGKDFILGEFGAKQASGTLEGKRNDACVYWDTPQEPFVAIQVAEAAIAAINAGIYAMGYWTFADFPDEYSATYRNKWGTFKWSGSDHSTRPHYYAYGLLTRYFRGPATVVAVASNDPRLRAAAVQHHGSGTWSLAVVNRNEQAVEVQFALPAAIGRLRKYVYDPQRPPGNAFGDLPGPDAVVKPAMGQLADSLPGGSLVVYTSLFDEQAPTPVQGVASAAADGGTRIRWAASGDVDLCYYRVYRRLAGTTEQIGSTVATSFLDRQSPPEATYAVTAVDLSGNEGPKPAR